MILCCVSFNGLYYDSRLHVAEFPWEAPTRHVQTMREHRFTVEIGAFAVEAGYGKAKTNHVTVTLAQSSLAGE